MASQDPTRRRSPYIVSPVYDWVFFLAPPLFALWLGAMIGLGDVGREVRVDREAAVCEVDVRDLDRRWISQSTLSSQRTPISSSVTSRTKAVSYHVNIPAYPRITRDDSRVPLNVHAKCC